MKITNDRSAFYGIIGETIDIYQVEHAAAAAFNRLGGRAISRGARQKVLVGHDTSTASDMMEAAVCAALCAAGADVMTLGTVPSGAVSYLTGICDALMGVMITGSSFDYDMSGLKFYQSSGRPVRGELLQSIHATIDSHASLNSKQAGKIKKADENILNMYLNDILSISKHTIFENLKIAVDCTGSSAERFAKELFEQMGIDVVLVEHEDSETTSFSSSYTNPSALIEFVNDNHCNLGFAFSPSGETCLIIDEEGKCLDTEKIAAIFSRIFGAATHKDSSPQTIMVSENCHAALAPYITAIGADCRTISGDYSHLLDEFESYDAVSPEEKGVLMAVDRDEGIIFPRCSHVPDGLLTAVMLLYCMNKSGMSLSELSLDIPKLIRATSIITIPSGACLPDLGYTDLPEQIRILRSYLSGDGRITLTRIDRNKVNIIVEGVKPKQVASVTEKTERLVRKNLKEKNGPIYEPTPSEKKNIKEDKE